MSSRRSPSAARRMRHHDERIARLLATQCGARVGSGLAFARAKRAVIGYRARVQAFCTRFNLRLPILLAPMAGACPPSLSAAVANAGGLGACGALIMPPAAIMNWATEFRAISNGPFQLNLWIPDPQPQRDPDHEAKISVF